MWEQLKFQAEYFGGLPVFTNKAADTTTSYRQLWDEVSDLCERLEGVDSATILAIAPNSRGLAILVISSLISGRTFSCVSETASEIEIAETIELIKPNLIVWGTRRTQSGNLPSNQILLEDLVSLVPAKDGIFSGGGTRRHEYSYGNLIVQTSGSEGKPKALLLSGERLWDAALAFAAVYSLAPCHRFWNFLPMSYLGGLFNLLLIPLSVGASVFLDKTFSGRTMLSFGATLQREKINVLWLVPTIGRGLLRLVNAHGDQNRFPSMDRVFIGTAPVSEEEKKNLEVLFSTPVLENYGLSETLFVSCDILSESGAVVRSHPFPGVDIRLDQETSEILVKTPFVMLGYYSVDSGFVPFESSWIRTGDRGSLFLDRLAVEGRLKEAIKKGGYLVNLPEVERRAREFVTWGEVSAIAIEDDFYGENYALVFETRGKDEDSRDLLVHLSATLSRHKLPASVTALSALSYTRSGKVNKKKTLEKLQMTLDRNMSNLPDPSPSGSA